MLNRELTNENMKLRKAKSTTIITAHWLITRALSSALLSRMIKTAKEVLNIIPVSMQKVMFRRM